MRKRIADDPVKFCVLIDDHVEKISKIAVVLMILVAISKIEK